MEYLPNLVSVVDINRSQSEFQQTIKSGRAHLNVSTFNLPDLPRNFKAFKSPERKTLNVKVVNYGPQPAIKNKNIYKLIEPEKKSFEQMVKRTIIEAKLRSHAQ